MAVKIREPVKIERYILISREGIGSIIIKTSNSIYIHVPMELRRQLENFGIDLRDKDGIEIHGNVALEEDGVKLIYSFKRRNEDDKARKSILSFLRRIVKG